MRAFVLGNFVQACCWGVARLPKAGETFAADDFISEPGGKGLNVAIGLKRLGAQVEASFGIGKDHVGAAFKQLLDSEGISTQHTHALAEKSGYGAGLIGADGQNAIAVYLGPNLLLKASHMQQAAAEIVSSNLVYAQFETAIEAIEQAFSMAKQRHITTALNPSPWQPIPAEILANTDIIIVNEVEASQLLNIPSIDFSAGAESVILHLQPEVEKFLANWGGKHLVITLGAHGSSVWSRQSEPLYCPAFKIQAVDTIGAGDAFAAGFCYALGNETDLAEALKFGNACGAILASKAGVLDALPTQAAVQQFTAAV